MSSEKAQSMALAMRSGGRVAAIVPESFDEAYRMAKLFAMTKMVPEAFQGKPEECCLAIMQGLEVGLSPLAALSSIAIINGRPSLWGDGALAVVRASGLAEHITETDDGETATCMIRRKGEDEPIVRTFSQADAKRAGLAGKRGPWTEYPQRMRQMRARSWALRDGFADVLKGLHIAEEQSDVPMRDVTPKAAVDLPDIPDAAEPAPVADEMSVADDSLADPAAFLAHLSEELTAAAKGGSDQVKEIWEANREVVEERLSRTDRAKAEAFYDQAIKRC